MITVVINANKPTIMYLMRNLSRHPDLVGIDALCLGDLYGLSIGTSSKEGKPSRIYFEALPLG